MGISAPRLRQSRHGVFVFRYLVPNEFQQDLGKKELRRSLRTKNPAIARLLALNLNVAIERAIRYLSPSVAMDEIKRLLAAGTHGWILRTKNLEFSTDGTAQDSQDLAERLTTGELRTLVDKEIEAGNRVFVQPWGGVTGVDSNGAVGAISPFVQMPEKPLTIARAITDFLAGKMYKGGGLIGEVDISDAPKVSVDRKTTMDIFQDFISKECGPSVTLNTYVHELQIDHIQDFLSYYAKRPANKLKKDNSKSQSLDDVSNDDPKNSVRSRALKARAKIENQTLSKATLIKQVSNISALITYCRTRGAFLQTSALVSTYLQKDLRSRVNKLTQKNRNSITYHAFDHSDLKKLFEPDTLFWCSGGQVDYIWTTLLALHMGFRTKELASLKLGSIVDDEGIACIELHLQDTKNRNSARLVPIPQKILDLGFLDYKKYVEANVGSLSKAERDEYPLWPHVNPNSSTYLSDPSKNISRFFSCYRRMQYFELNLNFKVFHSFRHTVVSVLEANKVDVKTQELIVGHTETEDGEKERSNKWGKRAESMAHAMNKRYTSDVRGYNAPTQTQHSKNSLDDIAALYELDYAGLKLAVKTAQDLLICQDAASQKWKSGFRRNQKKIIEKLPSQLIPRDMNKVKDFTWGKLKAES